MCFKSKFNWFISFATISVSLSAFATGSVYVWPSPYLPKFNLTDSTINPIGRPITITESTWIVAAMNAGLNFGPLLSFLGRKIFTKKQVILMAMLSMMLAHSICIFANKALLFILARLLMGISTGWLWTSLGTYIAEIAANSNRGLLGILPGIMSNIVNLICFSTGTAYSWTSPLIPKFKSSNQLINPIGRPLTPEESGLLVSLINLGLFCGPIVCGFIVGKFGKKSVILFTSLPLLLAHILCSFAKSFELFLVARILMGFTSGAEWAVIPGYLSEISDPKNRGLLNTLMMVASCLGCLFTYVVGPYVSVTWFSIFNLIPTILFFGLVYFLVPDSPYDLLTKKDVKAAKESLMKLKQTNDVRKDLLEIESILEENSKNHAGFRDIFKNRGAVNALFICSMLMIFNALAGTIIVLSYTQSILDLMGESIPSAELAIIVGSVSFLATLINCQLVDRLGRKPVIMLSCLIGSLSHASLGIFFHLQNSGLNIEKIKYLPICSVMIFMFSFYFGLAQAPYVILGELFSPKIKAVASTICTSLNFGLAFIITLIYPYAIATVGIGNTFLFFSLMLAICVIFCGLKLPETKGKTFQEIYVLLDRGANNQILKE